MAAPGPAGGCRTAVDGQSVTALAAHVPVFVDLPALDAGLHEIEAAPAEVGRLEMIVARPSVDERRVLEQGTLDSLVGLVGDSWATRRRPDLEAQVTLMSSRVIALLAGTRDLWPLAGDQLYVDFDLSRANVPPGTELEIGSAVLAITAEPHLPCRKFKARFGADAMRFLLTERGRELQLRGVNARVVRAGTIAVGDRIAKRSRT